MPALTFHGSGNSYVSRQRIGDRMKKRGNQDFPFNDIAPGGQGAESDFVSHYDAAPAQSNHPVEGTPAYPTQPQQPYQSSPRARQNDDSLAPNYAARTGMQDRNQPVRRDGYYVYPESSGSRQPASADSLGQGRPYGYVDRDAERRSPANPAEEERPYPLSQPSQRSRTLDRQIRILTGITAMLFIVILILLYFVFTGGSSPSGASAMTTGVLPGLMTTVASSDASASVASDPSAVTGVPSDSAASSVASVSDSAVDTDPTSLANLPPSSQNPVIALTFDDGPSSTLTPELLDVLKEKGVHVTFFVIGQCAADVDASLLKRMVDEGHEIGNHTWDHATLTKLTEDQIRSELQKTNDVIFNATGYTPKVMRPPTGAKNDTVLSVAKSMGLYCVNWSSESCPQDWVKANQTPEYISNYVIENGRNGHLVLLHDIHQATVDSVAAMIDGLKAKGFRFATVSELLEAQPGGAEQGVLYCYAKFS